MTSNAIGGMAHRPHSISQPLVPSDVHERVFTPSPIIHHPPVQQPTSGQPPSLSARSPASASRVGTPFTLATADLSSVNGSSIASLISSEEALWNQPGMSLEGFIDSAAEAVSTAAGVESTQSTEAQSDTESETEVRVLHAIPGISLQCHWVPLEMQHYLHLHGWHPSAHKIVAGILMKAMNMREFLRALMDAGMNEGEASYLTHLAKNHIGRF